MNVTSSSLTLLRPHPLFTDLSSFHLGASVRREGGIFIATFQCESKERSGPLGESKEQSGSGGRLRIPPLRASEPSRQERLWETTCFELFLQPAGLPAYWEINVAPRGDWAAYSFSAYRENMRPEARITRVEMRKGAELSENNQIQIEFALDLSGVPELAASLARADLRIGITAVLETDAGAKSYWAIAHADAKPDFHRNESFVHTLRE